MGTRYFYTCDKITLQTMSEKFSGTSKENQKEDPRAFLARTRRVVKQIAAAAATEELTDK